jgi:hypothetical protein
MRKLIGFLVLVVVLLGLSGCESSEEKAAKAEAERKMKLMETPRVWDFSDNATTTFETKTVDDEVVRQNIIEGKKAYEEANK